MSDQCKHCTTRGNYQECLETECFHHESWISEQHLARIKKLEDGLFQLKQEWIAQGKFLNNPHYHAEDRAAGRTYKECADILASRFGTF